MKKYNIALVGASGAVGREVLKTLEQRKFAVGSLKLFTSKRSAGHKTEFAGKSYTYEELRDSEKFKGLDLVFFTSGSAVSEKFAPRAAESGSLVVDNSSFFRMNKDVPLVVPEVNAHTLEMAKSKRIVANPNCTTAQMVMVLKPLHENFKIERVVLSSYQAVSGKGQQGVDEFLEQVKLRAQDEPITKTSAFPHPIAFNCLPHIDRFLENGFTGEEQKVMDETRKILGDASIRVLATCVRVPVLNCHSESVSIETSKPVSVDDAREILAKMPGVLVVDNPAQNEYPLAMNASGYDEVLVGRIRKDPSLRPGQHGLCFWIVADNLRKGAALNAVQIAEAAIVSKLL